MIFDELGVFSGKDCIITSEASELRGYVGGLVPLLAL